MLSLLVVSDTHGHAERLVTALGRTKADTVLFLGDGLHDLSILPEKITLRAVRGNCDWTHLSDAPLQRTEEIGGYRLFLTHGHKYGVKYGLDAAIAAAVADDADVLLYGHTHVPYERTLLPGSCIGSMQLTKPLLVVCPGSLGQPHDGKPSFATLTLAPGGVLAGFGTL